MQIRPELIISKITYDKAIMKEAIQCTDSESQAHQIIICEK